VRPRGLGIVAVLLRSESQAGDKVGGRGAASGEALRLLGFAPVLCWSRTPCGVPLGDDFGRGDLRPGNLS
jgi:hypothetical protein